jgi:hypothetical protein
MATPTNLPAAAVAGDILTAAYVNNLRGAFRVLQVVAGNTTTQTGKSSGTYGTTTLTASITPQSTSNKVLVLYTQQCSTDTSGAQLGLRLVQRIGASDTVIQTNTYAMYNSAGGMYGIYAQNILVSPASVASVTFFTEMALTGGSGNVYTQTGSSSSNIILMEISA